MYPRVVLKKGKEEAAKRRHPWIFSGAIKHVEEKPEPGDLLRIEDYKGNCIGIGFWGPGSIALRVISFEDSIIDADFWKGIIQNAWEYRMQKVLPQLKDTNTFRLFYGEGDGVPGLVIDVYANVAVFQAHNNGVFQQRDIIAKAILEVGAGVIDAVYSKSKESMPQETSQQIENGFLLGQAPDFTQVEEYGNTFIVNWAEGQKTGFFIDQRENRQTLGSFAKDKTVLNTFCYTGGFSIYALNAGAKLVHSVDVSQKAIELTEENVRLNGDFTNHQAYAQDTFDFLKANKNVYDLIVLDPPAFIKNIKKRHKGLIGYKRINEMAIKQIKPGGLLFTFSCSQAMNRSLFQSTVMSAAIEVGRKVRIVQHLEQPADHPSNLYHPEGEYLKGLVLEVE